MLDREKTLVYYEFDDFYLSRFFFVSADTMKTQFGAIHQIRPKLDGGPDFVLEGGSSLSIHETPNFSGEINATFY